MALPYYLQKLDPDILLSDNYLVVDFEVTSLDFGSAFNFDNQMLMAAWYYQGRYYAHWGDEFSQKILMQHLQNCELVVAHNSAFEMGWLGRMGMPYGERLFYCTMIGHYVYLGNRQGRLDLDSVAKHWGVSGKDSVVSKMMKAGVPVEDIPSKWVSEYCIQDVRACHETFLRQRQYLKKNGLLNVAFTRNITTPALVDIESRGMKLDCEKVSQEHAKQYRRLMEIEQELFEMVGEANLNSAQQLADILYNQFKFKEIRKYGKVQRNKPNKAFPDGQPLTDLNTIKSLKATNNKQRKLQELLIEQSKVNAALTKNLNAFKAICENEDGVFYGRYNQCRTATHRLSSSGKKVRVIEEGKEVTYSAQSQNAPRAMKPLFTARGNKLFAEVDLASLEFRCGGILAKDSQILKDVMDKKDVHIQTRDRLREAGLEVDRTGAKASTFRPMYSLPKASHNMTPETAYAVWFKGFYKELDQEQQKWLRTAMTHKQITMPTGLKFYFPNCKVTESGFVQDSNKILNYPIQSIGGAEIMLIGLVYMYWAFRDTGIAEAVCTVHDSVEFEVDPERLEEFTTTVADCMLPKVYNYLKEVYDIDVYVPLGIGYTIGKHWSVPSLDANQLSSVADALIQAGYDQTTIDEGEIKIGYYSPTIYGGKI